MANHLSKGELIYSITLELQNLDVEELQKCYTYISDIRKLKLLQTQTEHITQDITSSTPVQTSQQPAIPVKQTLHSAINNQQSTIDNLPVSHQSPAEYHGEIVKKDKRAYRRLTAKLPLTYRISNKLMTRKRVFSKDISGGGARFVLFLGDAVKINDILEVQIFIPSGEIITTTGKVVRVSEYADEERKGYEVGVEFTSIPNEDRVKIARFVHSLK